jgi:hypothetical protein
VVDLGGEAPMRSGLTMVAHAGVVTLLEVSSLRFSRLSRPNVMGKTLNMGLPNLG